MGLPSSFRWLVSLHTQRQKHHGRIGSAGSSHLPQLYKELKESYHGIYAYDHAYAVRESVHTSTSICNDLLACAAGLLCVCVCQAGACVGSW